MLTREDGQFFYHGESMRGMFRLGDALVTEPVTLADLCPGDVVVYRKAGCLDGCDKVVHRVMKVIPGGLILRGDNNPPKAIEVILEEDILARVTHVRRRGRTLAVRGGRVGMLRGRVLHGWNGLRRGIWRIVWQTGRLIVRPPYHWLRVSGLARYVWHPKITKVHIATQHGEQIKITCGKRTVAEAWPEYGAFRCSKPYDLVLRREDFLQERSAAPSPTTDPQQPSPPA